VRSCGNVDYRNVPALSEEVPLEVRCRRLYVSHDHPPTETKNRTQKIRAAITPVVSTYPAGANASNVISQARGALPARRPGRVPIFSILAIQRSWHSPWGPGTWLPGSQRLRPRASLRQNRCCRCCCPEGTSSKHLRYRRPNRLFASDSLRSPLWSSPARQPRQVDMSHRTVCRGIWKIYAAHASRGSSPSHWCTAQSFLEGLESRREKAEEMQGLERSGYPRTRCS